MRQAGVLLQPCLLLPCLSLLQGLLQRRVLRVTLLLQVPWCWAPWLQPMPLREVQHLLSRQPIMLCQARASVCQPLAVKVCGGLLSCKPWWVVLSSSFLLMGARAAYVAALFTTRVIPYLRVHPPGVRPAAP
jgi:hypothetical protein